MGTLDRYIGLSVARGYILVTLILFSLFSFLEFVDQLEDIGRGDFALLDAIIFVLSTQPRRMLDLVPFIALLGTVIALGGLAGTNEIIAMQAAGIAPRIIGRSVLKAGFLLIVMVALLDQFVVSPLQQYAHQRREMRILGSGDLTTGRGFWSRDHKRFINVREMLHGRIPADIDIYQFDDRGRLALFTWAGRAETFDFALKRWLLIDVTQRVFKEEGRILRRVGSMRWDSFLTPNQIQVLAVPPESLSVLDLYHYVDYLKNSRQLADRYEMVLWQKLTLPFSAGAMVLLAVPFVFGPMRSVSAGKMIVLGATTGIALYMLKQVVENTGLVLGLNQPLTVAIPIVITLGIALLMLRRVD